MAAAAAVEARGTAGPLVPRLITRARRGPTARPPPTLGLASAMRNMRPLDTTTVPTLRVHIPGTITTPPITRQETTTHLQEQAMHRSHKALHTTHLNRGLDINLRNKQGIGAALKVPQLMKEVGHILENEMIAMTEIVN